MVHGFKIAATLLISIIALITIPTMNNLSTVRAASLAQQDFFNDPECTGVDKNNNKIDVITIRGITCVIKNVIKPLPAIIALAAFGMLLIGGVKIMTAGGDPKIYASGMQTIIWAMIGVILLSVVWLILVTIEKFTGATVTRFGIP